MRRRCIANSTPEDWEAYRVAKRVKKKTIKREETLFYRRQLAEVTSTETGLWRLAKWAKNKSHLHKELPQFPPLRHGDLTTTTFNDKIDCLRE